MSNKIDIIISVAIDKNIYYNSSDDDKCETNRSFSKWSTGVATVQKYIHIYIEFSVTFLRDK